MYSYSGSGSSAIPARPNQVTDTAFTLLVYPSQKTLVLCLPILLFDVNPELELRETVDNLVDLVSVLELGKKNLLRISVVTAYDIWEPLLRLRTFSWVVWHAGSWSDEDIKHLELSIAKHHESYAAAFGKKAVTINFHKLTHLPEHIRLYGCPRNFSVSRVLHPLVIYPSPIEICPSVAVMISYVAVYFTRFSAILCRRTFSSDCRSALEPCAPLAEVSLASYTNKLCGTYGVPLLLYVTTCPRSTRARLVC